MKGKRFIILVKASMSNIDNQSIRYPVSGDPPSGINKKETQREVVSPLSSECFYPKNLI
jgi:hypothetical protein